MRRSWQWRSFLGGLLVAGLAAGAEPAPAEAGRSPRDYFPRNPLGYVEVRDFATVEPKLAALRLWRDPATAKKEVTRVADFAARQLALHFGWEDPKVGRQVLAQVKTLHAAVYPPASWPPEVLLAVEVKDPAELITLLGGPAGAKKTEAHRGAQLYTLPFSLNGIRKSTAAAVAGSTVLLSPYELRVRQALDVAAGGQGALSSSPGFAECAKRFSDRPVWCYLNAEALSAAGALDDDAVREFQPVLAALALPSYRWAGLGSTLGEGPVPFEAHVEFFPWNPLAELAGPGKGPDDGIAAAAPAEAAFFAAGNVGDPAAVWKQLKALWLRAGPAFDRHAEEGQAEKALTEMTDALKQSLGLDFEKELLPLLSGDLGCFVAGGEDLGFGLILGARDEAAAGKLMAGLKVKDGTVGAVGGAKGGRVIAARVGRAVILGDNEDLVTNALAAVAAGKTMAGSAACKQHREALGEVKAAVAFVPFGSLLKAVRGEAWTKLLAEDYAAAAAAQLTKTGLTVRSTGPVEGAVLVPLLGELDHLITEMESGACSRRLGVLAEAAQEFAAKNGGRWPAALEDLGPAFKAGAPGRSCPTSGKEYRLVSLGKIPEKAAHSGRAFVLGHEPEAAHRNWAWAVVIHGGLNAGTEQIGDPKVLETRLRQDQAILALADPSRAPAGDEDKQAIAAATADLASQDFDKREAATKKLREIGLKTMPALVELLDSKDLEVASRAEVILKELTGLKDKAAIKKLAK